MEDGQCCVLMSGYDMFIHFPSLKLRVALFEGFEFCVYKFFLSFVNDQHSKLFCFNHTERVLESFGSVA